MPGTIFYWVLNVSILGSIAGLLLLLIRRIRAFPRFGIYLLWIVPWLRLWMPIGFAYPFSFLNLFSPNTIKTVPVIEGFLGYPDFSAMNFMQFAENYVPMSYRSDVLRDVFEVAGIVWMVVGFAAVVCAFILFFVSRASLKGARHISDNIYCSDRVLSPAVYGILVPKIVLPTDGLDDYAYVLMHERVHIRRRDNLWRFAAILTVCVHWFNPLIWVFLRCFFIDLEMACDSRVLKDLRDDEKRKYAAALLSWSSGKTSLASAFGGMKVRRRIEHILSYKRLTWFSTLGFTVLILVIAVSILTNAT